MRVERPKQGGAQEYRRSQGTKGRANSEEEGLKSLLTYNSTLK